MPTEITTITVRPQRADALREYRDDQNLSSLDAAVAKLLAEADS